MSGQLVVGFVRCCPCQQPLPLTFYNWLCFLLNLRVILYCSTTQSTTATSSTEAAFLAAVIAAKHAKYLPAVILELGCPQQGPTLLYKDNMSAINMIDNRDPTEQSCQIDICHFAIQTWANVEETVMRHIPGILSIPDGLTKALRCVLCSRHMRCMIGYFLSLLSATHISLL